MARGPVLLISALVTAVLVAAAVVFLRPHTYRPQQANFSAEQPAVVTAQGGGHIPVTVPVLDATLLSTDPQKNPHGISSRIVAAIDGTPAGATIHANLYQLSSVSIIQAFERALTRGVRIQLIVRPVPYYDNLKALVGHINAHTSNGSFALLANHATRASNSIDHLKTYMFSRTGTDTAVVMNGSYNSGDGPDFGTYADMLVVSNDKQIYDAFFRVFVEQAAYKPVAHPLRVFNGIGWGAYISPALTTDADPVFQIFKRIPLNSGTTFTVSMFAFGGRRSDRFVSTLEDMVAKGVKVTVATGPLFSDDLANHLKASGVTIIRGCYSNGNYVHDKDWSYSYTSGGMRHYWTWIGSDNWVDDSLPQDNAVLGVESQKVFQQYQAHIAALAARTDRAYPCKPI